MKSVKQKRGPLRYDGEIDHGLTGGIHGAGIYLLKDPDLGMVAYGGNVEVDKKGYVSIMPYDGIRRQLRIFTPARIAVELKKNGFMRGKPIFYKKNELYFSIENREGKEKSTAR